jgi:hypothetical protein
MCLMKGRVREGLLPQAHQNGSEKKGKAFYRSTVHSPTSADFGRLRIIPYSSTPSLTCVLPFFSNLYMSLAMSCRQINVLSYRGLRPGGPEDPSWEGTAGILLLQLGGTIRARSFSIVVFRSEARRKVDIILKRLSALSSRREARIF